MAPGARARGQAGGLGGIFGASTVSGLTDGRRASRRHHAAATSLVQNAPARTDSPDTTAEADAAPAPPAFAVASAAPAPAPDPTAVADAGDDVSAAVAAERRRCPPTNANPAGDARASSLQSTASGAPSGQMLPGAGAGAASGAEGSRDPARGIRAPAR